MAFRCQPIRSSQLFMIRCSLLSVLSSATLGRLSNTHRRSVYSVWYLQELGGNNCQVPSMFVSIISYVYPPADAQEIFPPAGFWTGHDRNYLPLLPPVVVLYCFHAWGSFGISVARLS